MSSIKIIKGGLLTTIQDYGREGFQKYGIPVSGVMDRYSMDLANILVGNKKNEAVIEFTIIPPTIEFIGDTVYALTGADGEAYMNNKAIGMYKSHYARNGDILSFKGIKAGCRIYMAIAGGLDITPIMNSKSTYLRGNLGGFEGRPLKNGDIINIKKTDKTTLIKDLPSSIVPNYNVKRKIRVIDGTEVTAFSYEAIEVFLNNSYKITPQWDRMGYRLDGPKIQHKNTADIISGGINFGAIQVPGDGKPIIMMADRQTIGGYTKIANIVSVDLPYVAQMKPGDEIAFERISVEEAQELLIQQMVQLDQLFFKLNNEIEDHVKKYKITVNNRLYEVKVKEFLEKSKG